MKNINLSVSNISYTDKNLIKWNQVNYSENCISIEEFINLIKQGFCFCHIFNHNGNVLIQREKTKANFKQADCIYVDIDDCRIEMNDYINELTIKPTIAYTTFNNGKKNQYRFRLIYVLEYPINNIDAYNNIYNHLINKLEEDTNIGIKDNCCSSVNQQIAGNTSADVYINENSILDINNIEIGHSNYIIKERRNIIDLERPIDNIDKNLEMHFSEEYLNDFFKLDYKSFMDRYIDVYPFFTHTPLEEVDDDTPYVMLPDNYLEIKRYWLIDKQVNDEGETIHQTSNVRKIKDGENRRKKLFINGILRRVMMNDITYEYMLTMLVYELYYFIDNRKDKISKKDIFTICNNVMKADLSKYAELSYQEHHNFIVNDNYCIKYGVNRKQARNIAKKMINYAEIGNLYDCLLSDKDNIKVMKKFGLKISQKTLTRFKQDNGLTRNYNIEIGHSNYIIKKEENIIDLERPIDNVDNTSAIEEYEEENIDYTYLQILNKRVDEMYEEQIKMMNNIYNNKSSLMTNTQLRLNINKLLNKLKLIDDINELENKYDMMIEYIVTKGKLIGNFDVELLLRYANKKYLQIKDSKNMDYRFDEYCFTTYQYVA